jgi:hypothetical protein
MDQVHASDPPTHQPSPHQVNDHAVDVRLTQGFRASFTEPLTQVGARAAAAYGAAAAPGAAAPLLASCPACSCTVVEHTGEEAAAAPDGRPLPATADCWVDEPSDRSASDSSAAVRLASVVTAASEEAGRARGVGGGASSMISLDSSCCEGAPGCAVAAAARVEEASSEGEPDGGSDAARSGSDVERGAEGRRRAAPQSGQPPEQQQQQQQQQQLELPRPHPRRSRHHPEIQLTSQLLQDQRRLHQQHQQQQLERQRAGGAPLGPLDAAIVASPAGLTALSIGRPLHAPRCEWELDPRKVLVGRRLAVGGFAEVFIGKYEVSPHSKIGGS